MDAKDLRFPDWEAFTPAAATAAMPGLLQAAEAAVKAVEASEPDTFEALEWPLEDGVRPLFDCWAKALHLLQVMNSSEWREFEAKFRDPVVAFSLRVSQSPRLYAHHERVLKAETERGADPTRLRILSEAVKSARLSGVALAQAERERFNAIAARLAELSAGFRDAVLDATAAFKLEAGGKTYTIDDAAYPETMKHCADRSIRERLYRARSTRASANTLRIDEFLRLRSEQAALLGFEDYAALSLASKCAPSVAAVFEMLDRLDAATLAPAQREEAELGEGLEPWDRAFAAERLRERCYAYREEDLKGYCEFSVVLKGLFRLTERLFGIEVRELTGAERPSVWHPEVRFFELREQGRVIAHFYLDATVRSGLKSGGAWMNEFRNRCDRRGELPLAVVVLNAPLPDESGRVLLPPREVETLFHEFGHTLQCCLTRVGEEGAAGINLVEWDAVEVASQFMENWWLNDLAGIAIPAELKAKVRAAENFRAASACRRQLAFSKLDLLLHSPSRQGGKSPDELKRIEFAHFGLPILPDDRFLESFQHIFGGGYAAGYYGYKWAEVMSADCYGAFEEAPLDDLAKVEALGRRYRETVLALGGSMSALEVFRRFRGRDPEVTALLRQRGLMGNPA